MTNAKKSKTTVKTAAAKKAVVKKAAAKAVKAAKVEAKTSAGTYLRTATALRMARAGKCSQAHLAKELEVAISTYGGIERGDIPVTKERADKIAKIVGKGVKSIFKNHSTDKSKLVAL